MKYGALIILFICGLSTLTADVVSQAPPVADRVRVADIKICRAIEKRQPIHIVSADYPADSYVGKLYCWTKIFNAYEPSHVTHVWYWNNTKRAEVSLPIGTSTGWRTWSSKIIQPHERGEWLVEVLDENKKLLQAIKFYL